MIDIGYYQLLKLMDMKILMKNKINQIGTVLKIFAITNGNVNMY